MPIVIGKQLSRDAEPLLLGGPQTGYSVPQTRMEVGLHGTGSDVTGVTILELWPWRSESGRMTRGR